MRPDDFSHRLLGPGSIRGENSQYIFVLVRDSETKPWVIQEVNKKVKHSRDGWEGRKSLAHGVLLTHFRAVSLVDLVQSPGFKTTNVAPEVVNGEDLVRVTFTYSPEDKNKDRLRGGRVVLDPSHDWVVRTGEIDLEPDSKEADKWDYTLQYDYKAGSDHHPILTKAVIKSRIWGKQQLIGGQEVNADFDLRERVSIPESEFTLSAFGLPEPYWLKPKPTRWYLWFGLVGMLCLVLGATFWWLKRRAA